MRAGLTRGARQSEGLSGAPGGMNGGNNASGLHAQQRSSDPNFYETQGQEYYSVLAAKEEIPRH